MIIKYDETFIKQIKESYDFRTNIDNPYIIEKSELLIDNNFNECLKTIENYEKKISLEIKKFNPKGGKKNFNKFNNKKSINFIRNVPKERKITFLNEKKGEKDQLNKELNTNLNKLSANNSEKIFQNILNLYKNKNNIFDYNYFVDCLFDKAVMQPIYCPLYVKLLILLINKYEKNNNQKKNNIPKENEENNEEENIREDVFSVLVKQKCDLFMNMIIDFKDMEDAILNPDNYDDFCLKNKEKVYKKGFSQFIGELYKNRFVDSLFIKKYTNALCKNIIDTLNKNNTNVENASICLCMLVETTVNRRLFKNNEVLDKIREIKNHSILPKKLKFKFMDLLGD